MRNAFVLCLFLLVAGCYASPIRSSNPTTPATKEGESKAQDLSQPPETSTGKEAKPENEKEGNETAKPQQSGKQGEQNGQGGLGGMFSKAWNNVKRTFNPSAQS